MSNHVQIRCEDKIKPCPFCGHSASLYAYSERDSHYYVVCCDNDDCGMELPPREFYGRRKVEALGFWNDRAVDHLEIGVYGKAYDRPGTRRAYSYNHQPCNVLSSRLGRALTEAIECCEKTSLDHIDRGLSLLKSLNKVGFGVFELEEEQKK